MTQLPPRKTPPAHRSDAPAHASPDAGESLQDVVIAPPGQPADRVRPTAASLVERLRIMQMQGWSREEHHR